MTQYLGICMVIVVTGLVIAVLAKLVTGNILEEFERVGQRRRQRKLEVFIKALEGSAKYIQEFVKNLKEVDILEKKAKENASDKEVSEAGWEAFKKTMNEMTDEYK